MAETGSKQSQCHKPTQLTILLCNVIWMLNNPTQHQAMNEQGAQGHTDTLDLEVMIRTNQANNVQLTITCVICYVFQQEEPSHNNRLSICIGHNTWRSHHILKFLLVGHIVTQQGSFINFKSFCTLNIYNFNCIGPKVQYKPCVCVQAYTIG